MFKSVFTKYLTAFTLIATISFAIIAGAMVIMVTSFSHESQRNTVQTTALSIQRYVEGEFSRSQYKEFGQFVYYNKTELVKNISLLTRYSDDITVILVNKSGAVLLADNSSSQYEKCIIDRSVFNEFVLSSGYDKIGTLNGVFEQDHTIHGEVIYNSSRISSAYVFVSKPYYVIDELVQRLIVSILSFTVAVSLGMLLVSFFISKRISRPLTQLSSAAKSFATGKFDVRVPVKGHDELTELAIAFNNMAASLETNEQSNRNFLANVSHDLRSPMTTISGFIDGILDGAIPPEKYQYYLYIIKNEVLRLSRLVSDLLDISRIQAGERKFTFEPFDICEMSKLILISFEQKINDQKLNVSFTSDEDAIFVLADRDAIYQVIYNLCHNAIKFAKEKGELRVSIINKEQKVFISVFNEGAGIDKEDIPYVFDRFYKSDKSRGLDKTGTGLGLYISKAIIDAHGEEIFVNSEKDKYCEFTFTLKRTLSVQEMDSAKADKVNDKHFPDTMTGQ